MKCCDRKVLAFDLILPKYLFSCPFLFSKEDENVEENPAKRQRRDSGAKQRLCFSAEFGTQRDGQDPEEQTAGHSGSENGIEASLETPTDMDTAPDCDGSKENIPNTAPTVSHHQIATRSVTGRLSRRLKSYSPPKSPPPVSKKSGLHNLCYLVQFCRLFG